MQPIVYVPTRKRLIKYFLGSLAFAVFGVIALFLPHHGLKLTIATYVACFVGTPFFGLCAVVFASRLVRRGPELTITDDGFKLRSWGPVSWEEVKIVTIYTQQFGVREQRHIKVELNDPAKTIAHLGRGARMLAFFNKRWGSHIFVSASTLSVTLDELLVVIQQAHQRHLGFEPAPGGPALP